MKLNTLLETSTHVLKTCVESFFDNFENYRLRVLADCGWDGVINRV